eukprot:scaffold1072_cov118-Isochrysis_galbana.AAC.1
MIATRVQYALKLPGGSIGPHPALGGQRLEAGEALLQPLPVELAPVELLDEPVERRAKLLHCRVQPARPVALPLPLLAAGAVALRVLQVPNLNVLPRGAAVGQPEPRAVAPPAQR